MSTSASGYAPRPMGHTLAYGVQDPAGLMFCNGGTASPPQTPRVKSLTDGHPPTPIKIRRKFSYLSFPRRRESIFMFDAVGLNRVWSKRSPMVTLRLRSG